MSHFRKEQNVLNEIIKSREAIKRKYKELRQVKTDVEKVLDETFKPLERLVDATKKRKLIKISPNEQNP